MKIEGYLQIEKMGGGASTLWHQVSDANGYTVEFQEIGNDAPNGSGFQVFNTLGAALFYLALVADALAADRQATGKSWEIEEKFGSVAGQFITNTQTEGK
jgi:hypothetical protein